jgi:hypothetical protein
MMETTMKYLLSATAALLMMISTGSAQYYSTQKCEDLQFLARDFNRFPLPDIQTNPVSRRMVVTTVFGWLYAIQYPTNLKTEDLIQVLDRMINTRGPFPKIMP